MYETLVGVAFFDFGQKLRSTLTINRGRFDKGRVEGFEIERAVNVYTPSPCRHASVEPSKDYN